MPFASEEAELLEDAGSICALPREVSFIVARIIS
jgi:hypothetical protein